MNWSTESLIGDVLSAWSGDNLIYTIAFWAVLGGLAFFAARRSNNTGKNDTD